MQFFVFQRNCSGNLQQVRQQSEAKFTARLRPAIAVVIEAAFWCSISSCHCGVLIPASNSRIGVLIPASYSRNRNS
ncbi:unnamed protein product [Urochloa humidicola]